MPDNTLSNATVIVIGIAGPIGGLVVGVVTTLGSFWLLDKRSEHEKEQNRLERRIAARREWLSNLRSSVGSFVHAFTAATGAFVDLTVFEWQEEVARQNGQPPGTVSDTPSAQRAKQTCEERFASLGAAADRFDELRYSNPDFELENRIVALQDAAQQLPNRVALARGRVIDHKGDLEEPRAQAEKELKAIDAEIRALVGRTSQRVEELLEGVDPLDFPENSENEG